MKINHHIGLYVLPLVITGLVFGYSDKGHSEGMGHSQGYKHSFKNDYYIKRFESAARTEWQKPELVVKKMNIRSGDRVADIGAGTGYFTRRFAGAVGPKGLALGLDVEINMVEFMESDIKKRNMKQYQAKQVEVNDPELQPNSYTIVFLCNTYHHISNRVSYFKKVHRGLASSGRLVIVDWLKKKSPMGPPMEYRLAPEEVIHEMKKAGFILIEQDNFLPYQYYLEFRKK